ncbi:MAG: CDP-glycerol glycerophosphotransferase family protein [Chloroflexota bacterium]
MRSLARRLRTWGVRIGFQVGRRRPLRRQVVLATSHDASLRGNLAILREGLATMAPDVPVLAHVLAAGGGSAGRWSGRWRAIVHAVRAGYLLATSRVFMVDDYYFPVYAIQPRLGTTIIQAWHACGAFKQFGYSVRDKSFGADEGLLRDVRIHANYDVCLVSSRHVAPAYAEAFDQPPERFRSDLGIPRTDVLFGEERVAAIVRDVRRRYAIPTDKRVVLYAPTFRGDSIRAARADGLPDWTTLRDGLAADHVLLVRLHPFVRAALVIDRELDGFVTDVSDHPDINELLHVTDVLVTDYSSVIFEFALLGRPMVFFAPDLDAYERERGFYLDYRKDLPGPVTQTTAELVAALRDIDPEVDRARVAAFAGRSFDIADGRATERVITQLILPALDA